MADTFTSALGGHGAEAGRPRITTAAGVVWTFTFDVPQLLSNMEAIAEEAGRDRLAAALKALPDKDTPGSWGDRRAAELHAEHCGKVQAGAHAVNGEYFLAVFGLPPADLPAAEQARRKLRGGLLIALASLRVAHPAARMEDLLKLWREKPAELTAVMDQLGKELPASIGRLKAEADDAAGSIRPTG